MSDPLRRRAAFWGSQAGNLDFIVKEFEKPLGEKWPDDEDKEQIISLMNELKRILRLTRTRYIGVLMRQTAEEAENAEIHEENEQRTEEGSNGWGNI